MRLSTLAICFIASTLSLSFPAWAGLWPLSAWEAHYKRAAMKSIVFNIQRECRFNHIALKNAPHPHHVSSTRWLIVKADTSS